jgi:hypothetical protein
MEINPETLICPFGVTSMFTNIPADNHTQVIIKIMHNNHINEDTTQEIINITKII